MMKGEMNMKKLAIILALMFGFALISEAQSLTTNLTKGTSYARINAVKTMTNADTIYWQINYQPEWYNAQTVVVSLDSLAGNITSVKVQVKGRVSDQIAFANLGSAVTWGRTTKDTTIVITNATENLYRQIYVEYISAGTGKVTVAPQEFKFYNGLP